MQPRTRPGVLGPARSTTAALVVAASLLAGCGSGGDDAADGATGSPGASTGSPTSGSASASAPAPSTPEPVTSLASEPFSGYRDVDQTVAAWRLSCPPDFAEIVPPALTMGTAERELEGGEALVARQVAIFSTVDDAVAAADQLGGTVRERCPGPYEPQPGFVASTTTVTDLDIGAQGFLVDTTAEDGVNATAVLRRGNAVALVQASGTPAYPAGRTPAQDAADGARDVFAQLCEYEQEGC